MALNPVRTQRLVQVAAAAAAAPAGGRQAVYAAACRELGISPATLHRHLGKVTVKPERKQRSDAGAVLLCRQDALAISALLMESHRKTGKRLLSIGEAVAMLRANGEVRAERTCAATGEVTPLSDSAIARALRHYGLHPDQLGRASPAVQLKSLHPNHVWQIDASLCVLYYLNARRSAEAGLQVMPREQFYKNKPANLKRIEADRVWSYEATDHYSGAIMVRYVLGAESGANLADCFIEFIQKREGSPIHGVPLILMMDMGSANTSGLFTNLARRLQVKLIAHAPGNARATGQVEKARDLIEKSFESSLRLRPVADLDALNAAAARWACWYNANKTHSRHGHTRFDAWLHIRPEQLRVAPAREVCQALLSETPELRKVSDQLTVQYQGVEYDVRDVPAVMVGEKLAIARNPYAPGSALVVEQGADGQETLHPIAALQRDAGGFREDANVIGEDWARPADTQLDTNRKEVQRFAYGAATDEQAEAARKAKALPFGGRIDPYKVIEQAPERHYLPRQGQALQPTAVLAGAAARQLSGFEVASALKHHGIAMDRERAALVRAWHPDGLPEDQIAALAERLQAHQARPALRVVGA